MNKPTQNVKRIAERRVVLVQYWFLANRTTNADPTDNIIQPGKLLVYARYGCIFSGKSCIVAMAINKNAMHVKGRAMAIRHSMVVRMRPRGKVIANSAVAGGAAAMI